MNVQKLLTTVSIAPVLLAGLAAPAMAQGASAQQALEINMEMDRLAQQTASALANPALRGFLAEETRASRNNEQMLFFQETLLKAQDRKELRVSPGLINSLIGLAYDTEDKISAAVKGQDTGVNIYFPVDEHRQNWRGEAELLVAFDPIGDEDEISTIVAYSVATGERVVLDPNVAPAVPTLVIAQDEHIKHDASAPLEESLRPRTEEKSPSDFTTKAAGQFYLGIPQVNMRNDHEPWYRGDPEIYVLVGQSYKTSPIESIIHLPNVNDEDKWYYLGDGPGSPLYFFFTEADYSDLSYFHFMESDGGGKFTISASVEYKGAKVGLEYVVEDGDDNLGKRYIHKSQVPLYGYLLQSTGDMEFYVDKDDA